MSVLIDLASQRYDRDTLLNVPGKDRVMQSWIWQMGVDEGQIRTARQMCAECPRLSSEAFVTLVTGKPTARAARSRANRPSRRSTKRR